jgi:predicted pyridoxine 5'-phosphate oxidase superfamily flavin-nucleotide-binding protein
VKARGVYHEGEIRAQELAGERQTGESNGAAIGEKIMAGALAFVKAQRMVFVSSTDVQGRRWASVLFGEPGFLKVSEDRRTLWIALDAEKNDTTDPLWENVKANGHIGVLIIELETRRRLRVNGEGQADKGLLAIRVEETYANCPKYITRREVRVGGPLDGSKGAAQQRGTVLNEAQKKLLGETDVLILATGHPERGADASHRGGNPGFVEVVDAKTLRVPDYVGNSMFNTIGNLLVDPHFGMLIPDFARGRLLQLTGTAKVDWNAPEREYKTGGTHRAVEYRLDAWRETTLPVWLEERFVDYSPFNP